MHKIKTSTLRRFDKETLTYITYFISDEKKKGCFHRMPKENFIKDTSIKIGKNELYEIRTVGKSKWKNISVSEFKLWLTSFNIIRTERGWEPITLVS